MYKIIFIIILIYSPLTFAIEQIKEIKIEGISLGDSVIDHFPGRDIVNNISNDYDHLSDNFHASILEQYETFTKFDRVGLVIKSDSKDILFPVHGIFGLIYYEENIDECYTEKDKWVKKLGNKFKKDIEKGLIKVGWSSNKHPSDLSGRSHYEESKFFFDWGFINVTCFDMADHMGIVDVLAIDIFDNEVDQWLSTPTRKS